MNRFDKGIDKNGNTPVMVWGMKITQLKSKEN